MRRLIIIIISVIPISGHTQIPVTDGVTAGIASSINIQTIATNKLLGKMIAQQKQIISNQRTLIKLMREQNQTAKHTDDLKTEEIAAYKKAPETIIIAYQLKDLETVKAQIVAAAKDFVSFIKSADKLSPSDVRVYENKITAIVKNTAVAWKQTKKLLESNDKIIPTHERQALLQNTISDIRRNITKIKSFEKELFYINQKRNTDDRLFGN